MSIFTNTQVSLFTPTHIDGHYISGTSPQTVSLSDVLLRPLQPDLIQAIRSETDKDKRKRLKPALYAITPSVICKGGRKGKYVVRHTGLMAFDIDEIPDDIEQCFQLIKQIPHVLYLGVSASGNGLWGLILTAYPEKHDQHFEAMEEMFKEMGIKIDPAPRAVNALRYLAYDPSAYVNPNATKFEALSNTTKPILIAPLHRPTHSPAKQNSNELVAWFNQNCTIYDMYEILLNFGFNYHSNKGQSHYFTRPNKDVQGGLSVDYNDLRKTLYCFSSSVPMLEHWKREASGWSCSPVTALLLYGCGGKEKRHWKTAYDYIRSKL